MYRFKATYKDNVNLLMIEKFLMIDMDSFSANDFKGKDIVSVAWEWALDKAFVVIPEGFDFVGLELILVKH